MSAPNEPESATSRLNSEPQERSFLEAAPDATIIVDNHGTVLLGNAQAEVMFGHDPGTLVGLVLEDLMPARFRAAHQRHREQFERAPRTRGMGSGVRLWGRRRDGSEFPIEVSLHPMPSTNGTSWTVAAIRDIGDRLQRDEVAHQNERMAESDSLMNTFFANVSHELRTPLNAMIGFAELLNDEVVGPLNHEQKDFLNTILSSARHLHSLINEMLDLARIRAGRMDYQPTTFALRAVMDEVHAGMWLLAARKQIQLVAEVDPALDTVMLDALKLKQVLINFVANAIKFTPEGGVVTLRVRPEGDDMFRLEVEDTGPGIAANLFDKLFVEFQRLDLGAGRGQEGTGLGLALSKRLVEAQGGRVGVTSTPGVGSVFYAVLPRRHAPS